MITPKYAASCLIGHIAKDQGVLFHSTEPDKAAPKAQLDGHFYTVPVSGKYEGGPTVTFEGIVNGESASVLDYNRVT